MSVIARLLARLLTLLAQLAACLCSVEVGLRIKSIRDEYNRFQV